MEPRLPNSRKWSPIPKEVMGQISKIFAQNFREKSSGGQFITEGRIYSSELLVRVGYKAKGAIKQSNFEISIEYKAGKDDVVKLIYLAVDVAATMMEEMFSTEDDYDFPRQWQDYDVEGRKIWLQFSGVNSDLERQADQLLGDSQDSLIRGEDPEEELDQVKRILGLDPEENPEPEASSKPKRRAKKALKH